MYAPHPGGAAGSPDGGAMRRFFAAVLMILPLTGCVVYEHDHDRGGWRDRPHYYRPAPPPAYYGGPYQGWHR